MSRWVWSNAAWKCDFFVKPTIVFGIDVFFTISFYPGRTSHSFLVCLKRQSTSRCYLLGSQGLFFPCSKVWSKLYCALGQPNDRRKCHSQIVLKAARGMEGVWGGALVLGCLGSGGESHSVVTVSAVHTASVTSLGPSGQWYRLYHGMKKWSCSSKRKQPRGAFTT